MAARNQRGLEVLTLRAIGLLDLLDALFLLFPLLGDEFQHLRVIVLLF